MANFILLKQCLEKVLNFYINLVLFLEPILGFYRYSDSEWKSWKFIVPAAMIIKKTQIYFLSSGQFIILMSAYIYTNNIVKSFAFLLK